MDLLKKPPSRTKAPSTTMEPRLPTILTTAASDPSLDHPINSLKLRVMVSYGGHILPRPYDKSLTYIGGTTRLLLLDRPTSTVTFVSRISRSLLLNSRRFTLKYQLPNDDLDSLVSLSSDEDLCNFLDEYDSLLLPGHSSSYTCVRIFLFFDRPTTTASLGPLLERPDDEGWFLDALNSADNFVVLSHGVSDSAANAADLLFCEAGICNDVSKLAPAPIKVRIEDSDLDRTGADDRSSDRGLKTGGLGKPPLHSPPVQVHAVHHDVAVTYDNLPSPDSVTRDSSRIAPGSSVQRPTGGTPMNPTLTSDFPYLRPLGSEPAYLMTLPLVDHQYQLLPPQPQPALIQQHYWNARANYIPQAAVAGAGQVFVQSHNPMYVVPARANQTTTVALDSCAVSAPPLVQLPSGRQHLPHQQHNLPGIRLSPSTAVSSTRHAFNNSFNLFEQSHFYSQLPAATKAVSGATTNVSSETIKQEMQEL